MFILLASLLTLCTGQENEWERTTPVTREQLVRPPLPYTQCQYRMKRISSSGQVRGVKWVSLPLETIDDYDTCLMPADNFCEEITVYNKGLCKKVDQCWNSYGRLTRVLTVNNIPTTQASCCSKTWVDSHGDAKEKCAICGNDFCDDIEEGGYCPEDCITQIADDVEFSDAECTQVTSSTGPHSLIIGECQVENGHDVYLRCTGTKKNLIRAFFYSSSDGSCKGTLLNEHVLSPGECFSIGGTAPFYKWDFDGGCKETPTPMPTTAEPTVPRVSLPVTTAEPTSWEPVFTVTGDGIDYDSHCIWSRNWPFHYDEAAQSVVTFNTASHLHWSKHFLVAPGDSLTVVGRTMHEWVEKITEVQAGDTLEFTNAEGSVGNYGFLACFEDPLEPQPPLVSNFHSEQKILPPRSLSKLAKDTFGAALSMDGDLLAVGIRRHRSPDRRLRDVGAVYFYERNTETGQWSYVSKLLPPEIMLAIEFGFSVSLKGDWLAVGARWENNRKGMVYTYQRDGEGVWQLHSKVGSNMPELKAKKEENIGTAVSIDYPWLAVGSLAHGIMPREGKIRIFKMEEDAWTLNDEVISPVNAKNYWFGWSLAIDGEWMMVGTPGVATPGFVHVFRQVDGEWRYLEKIINLDVGTNQRFGMSVDIDKKTALIGARYVDNGRGATYVYHEEDGRWQFASEHALDGHFVFDMKEVEEETHDGSQYGTAITMSNDHLAISAKGLVYEYSFTAQARPWEKEIEDNENDHDFGPGAEDEVELEEVFFASSEVQTWTEETIATHVFAALGLFALLYFGLTTTLKACTKLRYRKIPSSELYGATL